MGFEFDILHAIQRLHSPALDKIMLFITKLGDANVIWYIISGIVVAFPPIKKLMKKECNDEDMDKVNRRRCVGVSIFMAVCLASTIVNFGVKGLFDRARPYQASNSSIFYFECNDSSFPSGHTATAFAAAMVVFYSYKKVGCATFILASLIAFSRMYFYVHYPTDIIAGIAVGLIIAKVVSYFTEEMLRQC